MVLCGDGNDVSVVLTYVGHSAPRDRGACVSCRRTRLAK